MNGRNSDAPQQLNAAVATAVLTAAIVLFALMVLLAVLRA